MFLGKPVRGHWRPRDWAVEEVEVWSRDEAEGSSDWDQPLKDDINYIIHEQTVSNLAYALIKVFRRPNVAKMLVDSKT